MKKLLAFAAMAAMLVLAWSADAAAPTKKKATAKKGAAKSGAKKSAAATAKKGAAKKGPAKKAVTWRNRQLTPTTQRYHEIQDALVAKGYLKSEEATGAWNQNSIDALKKFQSEQHLEASGKINSLSLIALGLGPKRDTAPAPPHL
jgi:hypothetical protein